MAVHVQEYDIVASCIITLLFCAGGTAVLYFLCYKRGSPTKPRGSSAELNAFRKHYSELQNTIPSPEVTAGVLYARGIIDENVKDKAQLTSITRIEHNQVLLNAVEQAIKCHPPHFHEFLNILRDEPTTVLLYERLQESYGSTLEEHGPTTSTPPSQDTSHQAPSLQSHSRLSLYDSIVYKHTGKGESTGDSTKYTSESPSLTRQASTSKETQTLMPLPQRLHVHVPIHCATIKAVTNSSVKKIPKDGDERLTLAVSILDSSSETPLRCVVALEGDNRAPTSGQMVCFLSLTVSNVGDDQPQESLGPRRDLEPAYYSQRCRKSTYSPTGKATFQLCFFQADMNYIVSLNIVSIQDEEGLECVGYTAGNYTGFISTVKMVERNAFKAPPLHKYEGPLASNKFHRLMSVYTKLFYEGKKADSDMIMSRITLSSTTKLDVKLYMSVVRATEKGFDAQSITQLEELFQKCHSLDSQNGFLLRAMAMMTLSQLHSFQGKNEKALECIHHSRSVCFEAAPSYLTSCVLFNDARILVAIHKGNMSSGIKQRILELLDRAIAHSYYGIGWERLMIFNTHVYKALFCLNGVFDLNVGPTPQYTPTEEDISLAEQHLKAVPVDLISEIHMHQVLYHTAVSDLNRWKENIESAREHVEMAKQLCVEKNCFTNLIPMLDARLHQLEPDTIDEILTEYEDQIP